VLQFGDAILHVSTSVVAAPDLLGRVAAAGGKEAKGVARHVDQLAAYAVTAFAHLFANDHEPPLDTPAVQLEPEFAHGVVVVQQRPLLHSLGSAFHPGGELGYYNVGQQALFQKAHRLLQFLASQRYAAHRRTRRNARAPHNGSWR
jgi:hypothetical protein